MKVKFEYCIGKILVLSLVLISVVTDSKAKSISSLAEQGEVNVEVHDGGEPSCNC